MVLMTSNFAKRCSYLLFLGFALVFSFNALAAINDFDKPVLHPAIPLLDENGLHVLDSGKPYSTRMSCGNGEGGGCHDIDAISRAYHFEMGREESDDLFGTYRGIPQIVSPGYFGGYNCMLKNNPQWLSKKANASASEFLDYGAPGLIKACAECHNGGGFAEKDRNNINYDKVDPASIPLYDGDYYDWLTGNGTNTEGNQLAKWNWQKSGVIEPDCLICHADFTQLKVFSESQLPAQSDPLKKYAELRKDKLIRSGYFRYANTAILEFLDLLPENGQGKSLLSFSRTFPDQNYRLTLDNAQQPRLNWNASAFDSNRKVVIPMLRFPGNDNCMICHETSHERRGFYGYGSEAEHQLDGQGNLIKNYRNDVHKGKTWTENGETRSIENCNVCHSKQYFKESFRNVDLDADHNFLVGKSAQDVRRDLNYQPGPLSCEYCHNGPGMGGASNPALPNSNQSNILDAHKELWRRKNYFIGYAVSTHNRVVSVHFDVLACQTCHIVDLAFEDQPMELRYRYREAEDGNLKYMPYKPATRYYWFDKNNNRVVSRKERLSVTGGVEQEPQSYDDVKALKNSFDSLLKEKGYQNPDTQMILTESNEYLITHNTRLAKDSMPCIDCHDQRSNGSYSSAIKSNSVIGAKKVRTVAEIGASNAYTRLVKEGFVSLDMPYHTVSNQGRIAENADDILYETKRDPFTSVLRANSQEITSGKFRAESKSALSGLVGLPANDPSFAQLTGQTFLFNNRIAGMSVKNVAVMINRSNANRNTVPLFNLQVEATPWKTLRLSKSSSQTVRTRNRPAGGAVASQVFSFLMKDNDNIPVQAIAGNRMLVKLPYVGRARDICRIGIFETSSLGGNWLAPLTAMDASNNIVSYRTGTATNPGYVTLMMDRLPQKAVLIDLKRKKKGC
jgi:hypothetical protein